MAPKCSVACDRPCQCRFCGQRITTHDDDPSSMMMLRVLVCSEPGCRFESEFIEEMNRHKSVRHDRRVKKISIIDKR